jgi:acylphosphatase
LQKLLKDLNNGPRAAHVVKLEKKEIDVIDGESSFIVTGME